MAKILVVDDDIEIQELLAFTLQSEGYDVVVVDNGSAVMKKVYEVKPDLMILDVMLPGITGYEVLERLRADPATVLIPVIMLTSISQTKDRITGIKLGADEYLAKPFEPYELVARVEGLLRRVTADMSAYISKNELTLENEIRKLLKDEEAFVIFTMTIENFDLFNERYGYNFGENMILKIYDITQKALVQVCEKDFSIYKLLGENLAFICKAQKPEMVVKKIRESFNSLILSYGESDKTREESRKDKVLDMDISFLMFIVNPGEYNHYLEVLGKMKKNSVKL